MQTTAVDMNSGIKERLDKAIQDHANAKEHLRKAASGESMPRGGGETYSFADPVDAFERFAEGVAKAEGAADLARDVYSVGQEREDPPTLYEAAVIAVRHSLERLARGTRYSDSIREGLSIAQQEGRLDLIRDLQFEIQHAERRRDERVELEAEKFAELVDADGDWRASVPGLEDGTVADNLFRQLRSGALMVLTDPELRGALDDKALEQLQHPFGYSPQSVRAMVQSDLDDEAARKRAEHEKAETARRAKDATRCQGNVRSSSFHGTQCDKTGRYVVSFDGELPIGVYRGLGGRDRAKIDRSSVRMCGTHLNSICKDWRGRWGASVSKVVDSKTDEVVYEKEVVAA